MIGDRLPLAAIRFGSGDDIDALLGSVVRRVKTEGFAVAGVLQRKVFDGPDCCSSTVLEEIGGDRVFRISQTLGTGSAGCRLDPQELTEAAGHLLSAISPSTDMVVLNRFGKGEADGHGFRSVIETACAFSVPVLTAVRQTYEAAWDEFTGGTAAMLNATVEDAVAWATGAARHRRNADAA